MGCSCPGISCLTIRKKGDGPMTKQSKAPTLSEAAKELRREYARKWREQHPEKCREYVYRYWERQAEALGSSNQ